MFKVGDKVRYIGPTDYFGIKYGDIVLLTGHDGVHFYTSGRNSSYEQIFFDLCRLEAVVTTTPHKHAELIKAWADCPSLVFQWRSGDTAVHWHDFAGEPDWSSSEIRIKPEPKPDLVYYAAFGQVGKFNLHATVDQSSDGVIDTLKLTFCAETHKLKSVEILK